jgi:hypothetical protein
MKKEKNMSNRYDYVKYNENSAKNQIDFKAKFQELEKMVDTILGPGRAQSLVHTKPEEAYMWVGKAIRDSQPQSETEPQEVRSNS